MSHKQATYVPELHIEDILKEVFTTLKQYNLYPSNHPIPQQSLERLYSKLKTYLQCNKVFELEIGKEKFLFSEKPIGEKNEQLRNLAFYFFSRHISSLQIKPEVSKEELGEFIRILCSYNEKFHQQKSVLGFINERDIQNIQVKEFKLEVFETDELVDSAALQGEKPLSADELYNLLKTDVIGPAAQKKILFLLKGNSSKLSSLLSQLGTKASREAKNYTVSHQATYLYQVLGRFHSILKQEPPASQDKCYQNLANAQLQFDSTLQKELFGTWILPDLKNKETFANRLVGYLTDSQLTDIVLSQITKGKTAEKILSHIQSILLSHQRPGFIALLKEKLSQIKLGDDDLLSMLELKSYARISASLSDEPLDQELLELPLHISAPKLEGGERSKLLKEVVLQSREASLKAHLNSVLVNILTEEEGEEHQKEIGDIIKDAILAALAEKRYEDASDLLSSLTRLKLRPHTAPYLKALIDLAIEEVSAEYTPQLVTAFAAAHKPETISRILKCLKLMGTYAVEFLVDALSAEENMAKRKIICEALEDLASDFLDVIIAKMEAQEWYVVRNIVAIIGHTKNQKSLVYLRRAILHPDSRVRSETVTALAGLKSKDSIEILKQALKDPDIKVSGKAAKQLGVWKTSEATAELISIVKKFDPFFKLLDLKLAAIDALARIGSPEAFSLLKRCSHYISLLKPSKANILREASRQAIAALEISARSGRLNAKSS